MGRIIPVGVVDEENAAGFQFWQRTLRLTS
jgi:hypothetical protein